MKSTNNYCPNCGAKIGKNIEICPNCGQSRNADRRLPGIPALGAGGIGWSSVTGEESCFVSHKKSNNIKAFILLIVIALVCFIGFAAYGSVKGDASGGLMRGVFVAVVITVFNILIFLFRGIKRSPSNDWEGTVMGKTVEEKSDSRYDSDGYQQTDESTVFNIMFCTADGRQKQLRKFVSGHIKNNPNAWNYPWEYKYYQQGEQVRYHARLDYYEKYDKTRESFVPCASCKNLEDARSIFCSSCGCLLFKGSQMSQNSYQPSQPYGTMGQGMQSGQSFQNMQQPQQFGQSQSFGQAQQPTQQMQAPQNGAEIQKKFCAQCGTQLTVGAKFCPSCGTQLM